LHVACWVEVTLFGGDDSPAAFGLHTAHFYHAIGEHASHAVTVGDLVKPVWRRDRANFHGFEQDVVSGVALVAHDNIASGMRVAERYLNIGDYCGDAGQQHVARLWDSACASPPLFGFVQYRPTKSSTFGSNFSGNFLS